MKNQMNYSPEKEPTLSAIIERQAETEADFTYSILANVISIVDLNLGIESVLRKIEHYHQGSIGGFKMMCRDSEGIWDGIEWDGKRALFFALRETEEGRARNKLLDCK
jgi:hypothetical protein